MSIKHNDKAKTYKPVEKYLIKSETFLSHIRRASSDKKTCYSHHLIKFELYDLENINQAETKRRTQNYYIIYIQGVIRHRK